MQDVIFLTALAVALLTIAAFLLLGFIATLWAILHGVVFHRRRDSK